jgi:hypothetical protein
MSQNTNLNTSPYFDDFDVTKNYQRVLFKPGTPIQARELTTLQSILQNQVEQFGKHFFKEGSVVIPGNIAYDPEYSCVQIDPSHLGISVSYYIDSIVGSVIKGETSGVTAKVENYITNDQSERGNYTLYVKYISASENDFSTKTFLDGENLITLTDISYSLSTIKSNSTFATTIISKSAATGSSAKIETGVYFIRGFFVDVFAQSLILDQYTNLPSYRVGLSIDETIAVASQENPDLYDNARGFSNFAAPGADRLQISASLVKKSLTDFNDENFIELMRLVDGVKQVFPKPGDDSPNLIRNELARRTYDEAGDYYVLPFKVEIKESLNDGVGNNGVYISNQLTKQGNVPSKELLSVQISPGKAYVRGYEVETLNTINLDLEKPRTTDTSNNSYISFSLGNQLQVNNVYGPLTIGYGTTVKLFSARTVTPGSSSGLEIGLARSYDLRIENSIYTNSSSVFNLSLFDIQTYTYVNLNSTITLNAPAFIEGQNSSAYGYLSKNVSNSNQLVLYQVSGTFSQNEPIKINGELNSRIITSIRDYSLQDICQVVGVTNTFTADVILNGYVNLAPTGSTFSINTSGIVTNSYNNFGAGISTGDIVSYTKPVETLPTYNIVTNVNTTAKTITLAATTSVVGVNSGSLPSSSITVTGMSIVVPQILNNKDSYLYAEYEKNYISSLDLTSSELVVRKSYGISTVSSYSATKTLETDSNYSIEPYSIEGFNLVYSDGTIQPLTSQNISKPTGDPRTIILSNLNKSSDSNVTLTATLRKKNLKTRKKTFQRANVLSVNLSSKVTSGTGSTSLNDGLTYSSIYGTRVQDNQICLNVPDVLRVLSVFESSTSSDPELPKLQLTNLNTNILNSINGELIIGQSSNAVGLLISNNTTNTVTFIYSNENIFIPGEKVIFQESKVSGTVVLFTNGDRDIKNDFIFYSGSTSEIADYSYLKRKEGVTAPSRRLTIIYQNYTIDSSDSGDFVAVTSFDQDRISQDVLEVDSLLATDVIDLRPRVLPYNSSTNPYSPFEYYGRKYDSTTNNTPHIISKDSQIILSYSYYLGRIDRLYVNQNGQFFVNKGTPSLTPKLPDNIETALEIGTFTLPPYVHFADSISVQLSSHKRYRMQDISKLEDRLQNVEKYTSLSLLETDTKNLTIRDSVTGLNKFKSGFFVDNFKSTLNGDISNPDFNCSIDTTNGTLRPQPYTAGIDLLLGSEVVSGINSVSNPDADYRFVTQLGSPNSVKVGEVLCLKYTDTVFLQNKFATRTENVNPFNVVNWIGVINLSPSSDTWIETSLSKKTVDEEGSYNTAIQQLGVDSNTGLSPIDWGSWETTWTGKQEIGRKNMGSILVSTEQTGQSTYRTGNFNRRRPRGQWAEEATITSFKDTYTNFNNVTTLTTQKQSREGIQYKVSEKYDSVNLGNKVVSNDLIHTMRSRNIEFVAKRLKPKTQLYGFFDNINVNPYIVPKLLEVTMNSGTFTVGENIVGNLGSASISFRLASSNHKYGPYNQAIEVFVENPYNPTESMPSVYSSTSSILNVDTASLELQVASTFYGYVVSGMKLVGKSSGAVATISNLRLITDVSGTLVGSLFLPDPKLTSTPKFTTGEKTFTLTTSSTNITISGATDSTAETKFTSAGTLQNIEETTLRIRNAQIERSIKTDEKTISNTKTETVASTSTIDRSTVQTRWVDPLAESFEVPDANGVFITKCDVFFSTKDTKGLPITMQLRTLSTGFPTQTILPFGEVVLDPSKVNTSSDGSLATTFTFESPVYLQGSKQYAVVLLSASDEYRVFISRMGEEDVTTVNKIEAQKIIVSQQPLLGSLFKSQNGATWDPSQLEDLKMTLYRANFYTGASSVRFYNPDLNIGNRQVVTLGVNPLDTYSRRLIVGIANSLTSTQVSDLTNGATVLQLNNSLFKGSVQSVSGSIGINSTLILSSAGAGFTAGFRTYSNISLVTLSGNGSGAKVNLSVQNGVAIAATVSVGGTGYTYGDTFTVNYGSDTDNLGNSLILSIPNTVGVIDKFSSLLITNVQGNPIVNSSGYLYYVGSAGTTTLGVSTITSVSTIRDGLHFRVSHTNHGMYSSNDNVTLSGIKPDQKPETLNADLNSSSTSGITVSSVGIFTSFENQPVSAANTGYVLVGSEVVGYTTISGYVLSGITRKIDGTFANSYSSGDPIYKYELNGVSLRRINTTHNFSRTDLSTYPIELDAYTIKLDLTKNGTDRTSTNVSLPELYFRQSKSCGSYDVVRIVGVGPRATQNIPFNIVRPNIQTLLPEGTSLNAQIRTFSGSTPDSNITPFIDQGFEDISLNSNNYLSSPRIICSKVNELANLTNYPGNKSFTMEVVMNTTDPKVSPIIDLHRVSLITVSNRINSPITNYATDYRVNLLSGDPTAAVYITRIVQLEKSSDTLKVLFDAYRHYTSDIRVLYRTVRPDGVDISSALWQPFPGYDNIDINGNVANPANNNGKPDRLVTSSNSVIDFGSYEFTANKLPQFTLFQIKIHMTGTNSSFVPQIKNLRVIATA